MGLFYLLPFDVSGSIKVTQSRNYNLTSGSGTLNKANKNPPVGDKSCNTALLLTPGHSTQGTKILT